MFLARMIKQTYLVFATQLSFAMRKVTPVALHTLLTLLEVFAQLRLKQIVQRLALYWQRRLQNGLLKKALGKDFWLRACQSLVAALLLFKLLSLVACASEIISAATCAAVSKCVHAFRFVYLRFRSSFSNFRYFSSNPQIYTHFG